MSFNSKYTGAQVEELLGKIPTADNIWHSGNDGSGSGLNADLLDGYNANELFTNVTSNVDTNLALTIGGTSLGVSALYASYTQAFSRRNVTNAWGDVNELIGGIAYNYGSASYWKNTPSGMSYGQVLALGSFDGSLEGQLAWDINHGSTTDTTKSLWWRGIQGKDRMSYAKWHQIAFTDSNVASATKASQDEAGSNIVATYVKKTVLESFQYFQYRGTCNNINAQTLPGMYDYADTSNAIAGTNYGILLCFYNRDFPTTWAWGVQVFFGDNNKFAYRTSIRKSGVWNNWVIVA